MLYKDDKTVVGLDSTSLSPNGEHMFNCDKKGVNYSLGYVFLPSFNIYTCQCLRYGISNTSVLSSTGPTVDGRYRPISTFK